MKMILSQNNKIKILANEVLNFQNHDANKDSFEVVTCPWNAPRSYGSVQDLIPRYFGYILNPNFRAHFGNSSKVNSSVKDRSK